MQTFSLPLRSQKKVKKLADQIDPKEKSPLRIISILQTSIFLNLEYGCDEAIEREQFARYPHQIKKTGTCGDLAILIYFICKEKGITCNFALSHESQSTHAYIYFLHRKKAYLADYAIIREYDADEQDINLNILSHNQVLYHLHQLDRQSVIDWVKAGQRTTDRVFSDNLSIRKITRPNHPYSKIQSFKEINLFFYWKKGLRVRVEIDFTLSIFCIECDPEMQDGTIYSVVGARAFKKLAPKKIGTLKQGKIVLGSIPKSIREKFNRHLFSFTKFSKNTSKMLNLYAMTKYNRKINHDFSIMQKKMANTIQQMINERALVVGTLDFPKDLEERILKEALEISLIQVRTSKLQKILDKVKKQIEEAA